MSSGRRKPAFYIHLAQFINNRMNLIMCIDFLRSMPIQPGRRKIAFGNTQKHTVFIIRTRCENVELLGKAQAPCIIRHRGEVLELSYTFTYLGMAPKTALPERPWHIKSKKPR